jgi:hypothetical protein
VQFEFLLYDVTSTYFESQALENEKALRGYSRDHQPDCKQANIGLVVTPGGLPVGYEVSAGNGHRVQHGCRAPGQGNTPSGDSRGAFASSQPPRNRPVAELSARLGLNLPNAPKLAQNVVEKTGCTSNNPSNSSLSSSELSILG